MVKSVLITRPEHDDTTFYCSKWAEIVKKAAQDKGLSVIDLHGERANRRGLESIIKEKEPRFVFFNGHGNPDSVGGHEDEILVDCTNASLLNAKITYAIACQSAIKLGITAVAAGADTFIGFKEDFIFVSDNNKSARPLADSIAKSFFESSNQIPLAIIKGATAEEALAKALKSYDYWISYYFLHGELAEAPQILMALMWDRSNLDLIGNPSASL